jgi:hypothetical protein
MQYIAEHAEEAGVFVYGKIGAYERHKQEQEDIRKAMLHTHLDRHSIESIRLKPFLDLLGQLSGSDRSLFLKVNPELQAYLNKYHGSTTGDKRLDKLVDAYFKLPQDSAARTDFLRKHHDVQRYFDKRNPGDAAIHRLLEVYFSLTGNARADFNQLHPEIQAYFNLRRQEKANESRILFGLADADPRLSASRAAAQKSSDEGLRRLRFYQQQARLRAIEALQLERRTY